MKSIEDVTITKKIEDLELRLKTIEKARKSLIVIRKTIEAKIDLLMDLRIEHRILKEAGHAD